MTFTLILIPVISAFVGWFAVWLLIKMLFHPAKPKKIAGVTLWGIFPKRQSPAANKLGKVISAEVASSFNIEQKIASPDNISKILPVLETHIDVFLREKLPVQIPMLGMLIGEKTILQVKGVFMKELEELFPVLITQYINTLKNDINLEEIVTEKISGLPLEKVEKALLQNFSAEISLLQTVGAVLGFVTGLIQLFLATAVR